MSIGLWAILGVVVLGAALAYGIIQSRRRDRSLDPVRDEAVRDQYRENGSTTGVPPGR